MDVFLSMLNLLRESTTYMLALSIALVCNHLGRSRICISGIFGKDCGRIAQCSVVKGVNYCKDRKDSEVHVVHCFHGSNLRMRSLLQKGKAFIFQGTYQSKAPMSNLKENNAPRMLVPCYRLESFQTKK